ncbi:MAG: zinc ribbon domain-containing protein [Nitrososphaerales archaeon]|jgi:uncharacterized membrane protein YvbJ
MGFCPNCGKDVSPQAASCPNCGHSLQAQSAPSPSKSTGAFSPRNLAYYSIICGLAALLLIPIPMMVLASVFGVLAIVKGEVKLGAIGLGIVLVWILAIYLLYVE